MSSEKPSAFEGMTHEGRAKLFLFSLTFWQAVIILLAYGTYAFFEPKQVYLILKHSPGWSALAVNGLCLAFILFKLRSIRFEEWSAEILLMIKPYVFASFIAVYFTIIMVRNSFIVATIDLGALGG